jgi:hypothetical protein
MEDQVALILLLYLLHPQAAVLVLMEIEIMELLAGLVVVHQAEQMVVLAQPQADLETLLLLVLLKDLLVETLVHEMGVQVVEEMQSDKMVNLTKVETVEMDLLVQYLVPL